jgi:polyisoprenoid-binding protein YceI
MSASPASRVSLSLGLSFALALASLTFGGTRAAHADAQKCTYSLDKSSVTVGWTAYKTSQKTAVNGSFKKVAIKGKTEGKNLAKLLEGLSVSVDQLSVDTGNPTRDKTLADFFFSKLHSSASGKIRKLSEKHATFELALDLNGKKKDVPMHYEIKEDKLFEASGNIDVLDFDGKDALDSLHAQCVDLHKGADGVSKTWSEVAVHLKGTITKSCQ